MPDSSSAVRFAAAGLALAASASLTACVGEGAAGHTSATESVTLRLGYFPNLTHATAIVGVEDGIIADSLGAHRLRTRTFNAGPEAVEALLSGAIDATYVGPGPATEAFARSDGEGVRVVSGATSGGAGLVVRPSLRRVAHLRGATIATPERGNTQDIALRYWLFERGLDTSAERGDVTIRPQDNGLTVETFASGGIDGAWVPEPYLSQLLAEGGRLFLDERSLWPDGEFATTNLLVRTRFLRENPGVVRRLLEGQVSATQAVNAHPRHAQKVVAAAIGELTGKPLDAELVGQAWKSLTFTDDPMPMTLVAGADHANRVGLLDKVDDLPRLYHLAPLNEVRRERGLRQIRCAAPCAP